jgi:hypothetical protein
MANWGIMTVAEYLKALPPERRKALEEVRRVVKRRLPKGYKEEMDGAAITYVVPLSRYPDTYNGKALWYAALSSGKSHASLHLMGAYGSTELRWRLAEGFRKAGKRLDMGKACIRFREAGDLPLDVIGEVVAAIPMAKYIELAEASRRK